MEKLWDEIRKLISKETAESTPAQALDVVEYIRHELLMYGDSLDRTE